MQNEPSKTNPKLKPQELTVQNPNMVKQFTISKSADLANMTTPKISDTRAIL